MEKHVKIFFQDWLEQRLSEIRKQEIEDHLKNCESCSHYFVTMSELIQRPAVKNIPVLQPDPYLPMRVEALAREKRTGENNGLRGRFIHWGLNGALAAAAIWIGVFLGAGLTDTNGSTTNESEIALAYYEAFSQNNIADQFEAAIQSNQGEDQ
ncbi:MAG: zf-HC2 domain-containing protein [Calditrichaceae bacterium]